MSVKLEGIKKPYHPKDSDEVKCETHGVVTTWGAMDSFQRLAIEEGLDTAADLPCLLERPALNGEVAGSSPASSARKRGRPKIGETRDRPWEAAGMSRTTWYRRQKELVE